MKLKSILIYHFEFAKIAMVKVTKKKLGILEVKMDKNKTFAKLLLREKLTPTVLKETHKITNEIFQPAC